MIKFTHCVRDLTDDQFFIDPSKFIPNMIVNGCSEHYGDGMLEALAEQVPDSVVYSHDPEDHLKLPNLKFYPYWYYWSIKNFENCYKQNTANDHKTYRLSCLNGVSRTHRILNYIWFTPTDDMYFTMSNVESNRDWLELPKEVEQEWNQIKPTLRQDYLTSTHCLGPACDDSYVHLVTETTVEPKIFITEKTWKPVASGQLFLILGNQGIIKHLRDQGIDCFDDIIDHSYDLEEDAIERIKKIHASIHSLLKEDLLQINIATKQRRIKNAELFWSNNVYD